MKGTLSKISKFFIDLIFDIDVDSKLLDVYVIDPEEVPKEFPVCTLDFVPISIYEPVPFIDIQRVQVKFWFSSKDYDYITYLVDRLRSYAGWRWFSVDNELSLCYHVVRSPFTGSEDDLRSITIMLEVYTHEVRCEIG